MIVVPPIGCNLIYFNATRCDNQEQVVVAACDLGPCQPITFGGGFFGLPGGIGGELCLTPKVGQYHTITNPDGDDYCVSLDSVAQATTNYQLIQTPAYSTFGACGCSLYRVYTAESCDGSVVNKTVYASPTSTLLTTGQGILIDTSGLCYKIVSYIGIKGVYPFVPGIAPLIVGTFDDCPTCIDSQSQGGGGTGGGGGGGS